MPKVNLTSRFIDTVSVNKQTDYRDTKVGGLELRVSPAGTRTWYLIYQVQRTGKRARLKIGRYPSLSLVDARTKAMGELTAIAGGSDPAGSKRGAKAAHTVRDLGARFIDEYAKPHKRTWKEDERHLRVYVYPVLGDIKLPDLTRTDIRQIIKAKASEGKLHQARLILATVRKMLDWAVDEELLEVSPALGIKPPIGVTKRERFLTSTEIGTVLRALDGASISQQIKDVLALMLLTGQRSGEVCGMLRREVDLDQSLWHIPSERTKNKKPHTLPLSEPVLDIIRRAMDAAKPSGDAVLFEAVDGAMDPRSVRRAATRHLQLFDEPWSPHDLRRTVATGMADIGIFPHIVEAALNHISGFRGGVAGHYNRSAYAPEKRQAMDRWADHVMALTNGSQSNVVPLRAGA